MKERPILFKGDMVLAILSGQKTMTRRIVKPGAGIYAQSGDRLWVRETWASGATRIMYRAGCNSSYVPPDGRWRPSIHMPRWASRIELEVTAVRVERLQDITCSDIQAEGLQCPPELGSDDVSPNYREWYPAAWRDLWISTGGDWDSNPFVWVVEFKRVKPCISPQAQPQQGHGVQPSGGAGMIERSQMIKASAD